MSVSNCRSICERRLIVQVPISLVDIVRTFDLPNLLMLRYKLADLQCHYKQLTGTSTRLLSRGEIENVISLVTETWGYCKKIGFENGKDKSYAMMLYLDGLP